MRDSGVWSTMADDLTGKVALVTGASQGISVDAIGVLAALFGLIASPALKKFRRVHWWSTIVIPIALVVFFLMLREFQAITYAYVADGAWGLAILQLPVGKELRVTMLDWNNNTARVSVPTTSGKSYRLEYKDLLDEPEWTRLPVVPGTGGPLMLTDPAAPGPQRFYRVREE